MSFKLASLWLIGFAGSGAMLLAQRAGDRTKPAPGVETKLHIVTPSQLIWTDPPTGAARGTPSVVPGGSLRYAPIQGDPLKPGVPYAMRLRCSDGYKVAPHWHGSDETFVVFQGTFSVGTGDTFDTGQMQDIPTGGYGRVPGRMHHTALCKGETEMLVYGIGPRLNYWIDATSATPRDVPPKPIVK